MITTFFERDGMSLGIGNCSEKRRGKALCDVAPAKFSEEKLEVQIRLSRRYLDDDST